MLRCLRALARILYLCFRIAFLHVRNVLFRNSRSLRTRAEADTAPVAQGDNEAREFLAATQEKGGNMPQDAVQEIESLRRAAEQGNAVAQNNLGVCYDNGNGVPQDAAQAVLWYRKAAEQGYDSAQYNLGWCYANGEGVPREYAQAFLWYRKAAEQGHAQSIAMLQELGQEAPSVRTGA